MEHSFHCSICFIVVVVAVTIVLSIEEQHLCQALSLETTTLQELRQDRIPGIWKLTTSALPYDNPLPKIGNANDDGNGAETKASATPTILLKLNRDGTFKQCDEGYAEGRWITGRWKVKLLESSVVKEEDKNGNSDADEPLDESIHENSSKDFNRNDDENKSLFLLLVLAMNRQYFGPPYDVLLESATSVTTTATIASDGEGRESKQENEQAVLSISSNLSSLQHWHGDVRTGKFRRPSPGKHVLDDDNVSVLQPSDTTTGSRSNLLSNSKVLGNFSMEQALAWTSMDRRRRRRGANGKTNAKEIDNENTKERSSTTTTTTSARPNDEGMARSIEDDENDDDTFFVPNSNQGVLE